MTPDAERGQVFCLFISPSVVMPMMNFQILGFFATPASAAVAI